MRQSLIVLAAALVMAASCATKQVEQPLPQTIADLNAVKSVEIQDGSGQLLLRGEFATRSESASAVERKATLTGVGKTNARASADIGIERSNGVVKKDEMEVQAEGLPAKATLKLIVDGQLATTFTTSDNGKVDLKLSRKTT
jgi:hypothetical protein